MGVNEIYDRINLYLCVCQMLNFTHMCLSNVKLYSYELSFHSVKDVLVRGGVTQFLENRWEGSLSFFR